MSNPQFVFPKFWSRWSGIPKHLPYEQGVSRYSANYERFVKADCVIAWNDQDTAWGYHPLPGSKRRCLILKNNTNYQTIGQFFDVSDKQAEFLNLNSEPFPEEAKKLATEKVNRIVCLVRS